MLAADTVVRLVGDFDGDGMDEILVSSPWGIGILKMVGGALTSVAMHAYGEDLGGLRIGPGSAFVLCDKLAGGLAEQIVVSDTGGIHVLRLAGGRLGRMAGAANGTRVDGWIVDTTSNRWQRAGDLTGDGRAEMVVRSPWGVGLMSLDGANSLRCVSGAAYGSTLNDWYLQSGDTIVGAGTMNGSVGRKELVIVKT